MSSNKLNYKIINLTGESGSGKSTMTLEFDDRYIIIDTDEVFSRFEKSKGINKEFGEYLRNKYDELPSLFDDFDLIYEDLFGNQYYHDLYDHLSNINKVAEILLK